MTAHDRVDLTSGSMAGADVDDAELAALALAADPDAPLDPAAVPMDQYLAGLDPADDRVTGAFTGDLPSWYMAPVAARRLGRGPRAVILAFVGSLLVIEAFGLCSTYGQLPFH